MAGYIDQEGIERQCPHSEYGDRIPTHEDAIALARLVDVLGDEDVLRQAIASYCRQFRDVAGPDKEG